MPPAPHTRGPLIGGSFGERPMKWSPVLSKSLLTSYWWLSGVLLSPQRLEARVHQEEDSSDVVLTHVLAWCLILKGDIIK